jgi:hypothetical protein
MELLPVVSAFRRRIVFIAIGFVLACAAGALLGKADTSSSGRAWTRVLFDTRKSQLVVPAPLGVETLGWRGQLATNLLQTTAMRRRMAAALEIPVAQLRVIDPVLAGPTQPASLPNRATKSAFGGAETYVLLTTLDSRFPIVTLEGTAPTADEAARLVRVATGMLELQSSSAENRLLQPIEFENSGVFEKRTIATGGGIVMALAAAVFFFIAWTGAALLVTLLLDRAREHAAALRKIGGPQSVDLT